MKRRDLLRRTAAGAGALALAGCVSDEPAQDEPGAAPDEDTTETPTATPTPTPSPPSLVDSELARSDARCAADAERNVASVEFGEDGVAVAGAIGTSDPCYTAALEDASYDADADRLTVTVSVSADGAACAQCVAVVKYEATATFEDGLPGTVVVRHSKDGEVSTVATTQRN